MSSTVNRNTNVVQLQPNARDTSAIQNRGEVFNGVALPRAAQSPSKSLGKASNSRLAHLIERGLTPTQSQSVALLQKRGFTDASNEESVQTRQAKFTVVKIVRPALK